MNHVLPLTKHQACQRLITHSLKTTQGLNWSKEIKLAQKIIDLYPYVWNCNPALFKVGLFSLAWYLTKEGLKYLEQNKPLELPKAPEYKLEDAPIGENIILEKYHPKNVLDFVRNN